MRKFVLALVAVIVPLVTFAQSVRTITGQVLDNETKETLIGATVFIDPKDGIALDFNPQGTVADADGKFSFTLPKDVKHVIVSYLGYEPKKLDISKQSVFKVMLESNAQMLGDVVVTGYQKIEKRKVTSAIAKVNLEDIQQVGVASVDQLLQGQLSGVVSTPTNGGPGSANKIRIRGTVSLNGSSDPLWVVDGLPLEGNDIPKDYDGKDNIDNLTNVSIAGLNPDDIEDITILKDAAATAIYGARAANGVIVVTTKKGKKGKMKINVNAATFITTRPDLSQLDLMNATEKVDFELGLANRSDLTYRSGKGDVMRILNRYNQLDTYRSGGFSAISPEAQREINTLRNINTDWGKEIYRTAINQQYGLSLSGGGDLANYYVSTGYFNEQGTTKGTGYERFNLTSNTDFTLSSKVNLSLGLFGSQSKRESYISDTDAFTNPSRYTRTVNPYRSLYDEKGKYIYDQDIDGVDERYMPFNYMEESANTNYELNNTAIKALVSLDYKVMKGLKLNTQFGIQYDKSSTEKFADKETYFTRKFRDYTRYVEKPSGKTAYFLPDGGIIQNWNNDFFQYNWKAQADYSRRFNDAHDIDVMAGVELRGNTTTEIHSKGFGFDSRTLTTKPLVFPEGTSTSTINDKRFLQYAKRFIENRFASYYGTASYTYDNRYTVFGSIRFDGSNLFGVDPKYRYLPLWSISGAWNINREEFMQGIDWINNLKLRGSYGLQGNVDKNTSPLIVGEWGNSTVLPGVNEPAINVSSPPNKNLRWEKTSTYNGGLDLSVLDNRISLSVEGYYRDSRDLIGVRAIPVENGFLMTTLNWARVTNKGFELSLSTVNIRTKDFRWSTDFNFSRNISKVNDIHVQDNSYSPSLKGYPVNAQFAIKTAGLDENGLPLFEKDGKKVTGSELFDIREGAWGILESGLSHAEFRNLFTYVGDLDPKFTGGFINKFRYKDFDLAISCNFNIKQTVKEQPFYNPTTLDRGSNYGRKANSIWSPDNKDGIYPALLGETTAGSEADIMRQWYGSMDPGNTFRSLDIWYKDISYLRVSSIRFGYTLPQNLLKNKFISNARFSFEARNPFVIGTDYSGYFAPETYGNIYAQPISKSYSIGVNLTF